MAENNKARQKRLKGAVKLAPGQTLHFTPGRGYWAGPKKGPRPVNPLAPLSTRQLNTQAGQQATAGLAPERAEIERQRAIAAGRAKADQAAMLGLGVVTAEMQRGLVPGVQGAYSNAAAQTGQLAQGFSSGVQERLAAGQQESQAFAASQGQDVGQIGPNTGDVKDVLYGLGGFIPGSSLAAQGAAAGAHAAAIPAITALALKGDYQRALFEARSQDDEFAQQMIQVATKYPGLRNQALEALRKHEMDKRGARLDQRQQTVQERAQRLLERQFNEDTRAGMVDERLDRDKFTTDTKLAKRQLTIDKQQLQLDTKEAKADLQQSIAEGRQVDASASKVLGYIVDKQGREVLDKNGRRIPVKEATSRGKGGRGGTAEERNPYRAAVQAASVLRGDPELAPEFITTNGRTRPPRGKYMTRRGVKGGFPDGTTKDAARAQFNSQYSFVEALSFLAGRYGIPRAQARKALISSGWKPDGKRPKG